MPRSHQTQKSRLNSVAFGEDSHEAREEVEDADVVEEMLRQRVRGFARWFEEELGLNAGSDATTDDDENESSGSRITDIL